MSEEFKEPEISSLEPSSSSSSPVKQVSIKIDTIDHVYTPKELEGLSIDSKIAEKIINFSLGGLPDMYALLQYMHSLGFEATLYYNNRTECSIVYFYKDDVLQDIICAAITVIQQKNEVGSYIKPNTECPTILSRLIYDTEKLHMSRKSFDVKCNPTTCEFCGILSKLY